MSRTIWILLDITLATVIAILGNIVASYLQDHFGLAQPLRFVIVVLVFVFCLGLLLVVTMKRSSDTKVVHGTTHGQSDTEVKQRINKIKHDAKVTGIKADEIIGQASIDVNQEAKTVSGEMTGVRVGRLASSDTGDGESVT